MVVFLKKILITLFLMGIFFMGLLLRPVLVRWLQDHTQCIPNIPHNFRGTRLRVYHSVVVFERFVAHIAQLPS